MFKLEFEVMLKALFSRVQRDKPDLEKFIPTEVRAVKTSKLINFKPPPFWFG